MIERPPFQTGNLRKAAIPDLETFRKIRDNTHSIGDICSKMNRQLKALLPAGLFLCARLIELDYTAGKIHVWSTAGSPI